MDTYGLPLAGPPRGPPTPPEAVVELPEEVCAAISALEWDLFPANALTDVSVAREARASRVLLVRAPAGDVEGYAILRRPHDARDAADLLRLGVARHARRRGIATLLLERVIAEAHPHAIVLLVHRDNPAAHALYRRHGFLPTGYLGESYVLRRPGAAHVSTPSH